MERLAWFHSCRWKPSEEFLNNSQLSLLRMSSGETWSWHKVSRKPWAERETRKSSGYGSELQSFRLWNLGIFAVFVLIKVSHYFHGRISSVHINKHLEKGLEDLRLDVIQVLSLFPGEPCRQWYFPMCRLFSHPLCNKHFWPWWTRQFSIGF